MLLGSVAATSFSLVLFNLSSRCLRLSLAGSKYAVTHISMDMKSKECKEDQAYVSRQKLLSEHRVEALRMTLG